MDAKVRRRIYPELRIKQTHLFPRILGVLFILIGLGLVVGNVVLAVKDHDSARLLYALFGLLFSLCGAICGRLGPLGVACRTAPPPNVAGGTGNGGWRDC